MLALIVGYCSILTGALWTSRPESLRQLFIGKSWRLVFWLLVGMLSYPLIHFGNRLGLVGFVAVFLLFWYAMKVASSAIKAVFCRVPIDALRIVGLLNLLSGIALVWRVK